MSKTMPDSTYAFGRFRLTPAKRQLLDIDDQTMALRGKNYDVLWYLLQNKGRLVSKSELLEAVWPDTVVEENNLNQAVSALRDALDDNARTPELIATIKGRGFQFIGDVHVLTDADSLDNDSKQHLPATENPRGVVMLVGAAIVVAIALFAFNWDEPSADRELELAATEVSPSIAVLPFDNRSADENDAFFVDGIHDDILTSIAKIGSIKVISRTSVEQFREPGRVIPEIAAELGVSAVLEGAVQRVGDRVRINVQLIDAATDEHVWAETYDRQLTVANIFSIQSEVSSEIATALHAQLTPQEKVRIGLIPTNSLEAYEAYLLGVQKLRRRTGAALEEAREYFQKAIALDPAFALAYVGLADSYLILLTYSNKKWSELEPPARTAVEKAIELDASLGEAYATLAMINTESGEHEIAGEQFQRAITLSPNYATAYFWFASHYQRTGQLAKSLEQNEIAARLDPLSPIIRFGLGSKRFLLGQYAESEIQLRKAIEIDPEFAHAYWSLSILHEQIFGELDEAAALVMKAINIDPGAPLHYPLLANIYIDLGDEVEAARWLAKAEEFDRNDINYDITVMLLAVSRGDKETAVQISRSLLDTYPTSMIAAIPAINDHLAAGRFEDAIEIFRERRPHLFSNDDFNLSDRNFRTAIVLVNVYQSAGMTEQAERLLNEVSAFLNSPQIGSFVFFQISDVQILTLQGKKSGALAAFRRHADSGWRYSTYYHLDQDPILDSIRNEPEFIEIADDIRAGIAAQRESLQEMLLREKE